MLMSSASGRAYSAAVVSILCRTLIDFRCGDDIFDEAPSVQLEMKKGFFDVHRNFGVETVVFRRQRKRRFSL